MNSNTALAACAQVPPDGNTHCLQEADGCEICGRRPNSHASDCMMGMLVVHHSMNDLSEVPPAPAVVGVGFQAAADGATRFGQYWLGYFKGPFGYGIRLNPCSRTGRLWRSTAVRIGKHATQTRGAMTIAKQDNRDCYVAIWSNPAAVWLVAQTWSLSPIERNRLKHALNGNPRAHRDKSGDRAAADIADMGLDDMSADDATNNARELKRQQRMDDGSRVVKERDCRLCGMRFPVTASMMKKSSNHKSKGKYYGFDLCVDCASAGGGLPAPPAPTTPRAPSGPPSSTSRKGQVPYRDDASDAGTANSEMVQLDLDDLLSELTGSDCHAAAGHWPHRRSDDTVARGDPVELMPKTAPCDGLVGLYREFSEPIDDSIYGYTRVGPGFATASICGQSVDPLDWCHAPTRSNGALTAVLLGTVTIKGVEFKLIRFTKGGVRSLTRGRATSLTHVVRNSTRSFESFRGDRLSVIREGKLDTLVPTDVFDECLRYFSSNMPLKVITSQTQGVLKLNKNLTADDVDVLIAYACSWYDSRVVAYTRQVLGSSDVQRRLTAIAQEEEPECPWYCPRFLWCDPLVQLDNRASTRIIKASGVVARVVGEISKRLVIAGATATLAYAVARVTGCAPGNVVDCINFLTGHGPSGNPIWYSVFVAPINEEMLKHLTYRLFGVKLGDLLTALIVWIEATTHARLGAPWWFYAPTGLMHVMTGAMPRGHATIAHVAWNLIAELTPRVHAVVAKPGALGFWSAFAVSLAASVVVAAINAPRGHKPTTRRVAAMGVDSEFEALMSEPGFEALYPIKKASHVTIWRRTSPATKGLVTMLMPEFVPIASYEANQGNVLHSLHGRVLLDTPAVTIHMGAFDEVLAAMASIIGNVTAVSFAEWVAHFPPAKRERYTREYERLEVFGLMVLEDEILGVPNKWRKRSCFIKQEVCLKQPDRLVHINGKTFTIAASDPRTIQASTDTVQVAFGPFCQSLSDRSAAIFDGGEASTVLGWRVCLGFGRTKTDCAAAIQRVVASGQPGVIDCGDDVVVVWDGRVIAMDAKRWDAHVGVELLRSKTEFYRRVGLAARLADKLQEMEVREGTFKRLGIRFRTIAGVASGDFDTLFGNSVKGVGVVISSARQSRNVSSFLERCVALGIEYEVACETRAGLIDPNIDFCSCIMLRRSDDEWTLAPKLGRALMKLSGTVTQGRPDALLSSKLQGAIHDLSAYGAVVRELARLLARLPSGRRTVDTSYFAVGEQKCAKHEALVNAFACRYGVSYDAVVCEVRAWVDLAIAGELFAGELVTLRRLVEVDYGKTPMATPASARRESRHALATRATGAATIAAAVAVAFCVGTAAVAASKLLGVSTAQTLLWSVSNIRCPGACGVELCFLAPLGVVVGWAENKTSEAKTPLSTPTQDNNMPKNGNNNNKAQRGAKKKQPRSGGGGRKTLSVKGSGAYSLKEITHKVMSMIPKGTFSAAGGALGSAFGGPIGGLLGGAAGKGLSMFTGYGDYILNDIVHKDGGIAKMDPNSPRLVVHSEFVADIVSPATPSAFTVATVLGINPGEPKVFPWLAPIAQRFAKYRFKQLIFEFRSTSSEYATGAALGTVILVPNYNPIAPTPANKITMEAMTGAVSAKPSNGMYCGIECDPSGNPFRWVRNGSTNEVSQLTDLCDFYVATSGLSAPVGAAIGELWVHYALELSEPFLSTGSTIGQAGSSARFVNGTGVPAGKDTWGFVSSSSAVSSFGAPGIITNTGKPSNAVDYSVAFDIQTPGLIYFKRPGQYVFEISMTTATAFASTNAAFWTYILSDTSASVAKTWADNAYITSSASASTVSLRWAVTIVNPDTTLTTLYNSAGWGTLPSVAGSTFSVILAAQY